MAANVTFKFDKAIMIFVILSKQEIEIAFNQRFDLSTLDWANKIQMQNYVTPTECALFLLSWMQQDDWYAKEHVESENFDLGQATIQFTHTIFLRKFLKYSNTTASHMDRANH